MKLVLVMMAATAFIEKTGFFGTFMKKYLLRAPRGLVTFAVVFVGVNSNLMSDAGTLFALTMGGIIFAALGRNPLIGVILGWASSSGGFTANLFLAGTDALLAGITEGVGKEMRVAVDINPAMNYFFMASATFFLSVTLTLFTEKVVCRMVGDGDGKVNMALLEEHKLTADQEKGLRWAFYGFLFFLAVMAALAVRSLDQSVLCQRAQDALKIFLRQFLPLGNLPHRDEAAAMLRQIQQNQNGIAAHG